MTATQTAGLGRGVTLFLRHCIPFVVVMILFNLPMIAFFSVLLHSDRLARWAFEWVWIVEYATPLLMLIGGGAVSRSAYQILSGGKRSSVRAVLQSVASWSTVGSALMVAVAIYIVWLVCKSALAETGGGLAILLALVPLFGVYTFVSMSVSVAAVERPGPIHSVRLGVELSRGRRLAIFGSLVLLTLGLYGGARLLDAIVQHMSLDFEVAMHFGLFGPILMLSTAFAVHAVFNAVFHYSARSRGAGVGIRELEAVFE